MTSNGREASTRGAGVRRSEVPQPRRADRYLGPVWFAAIAAGLALAIVVLTPGGPKRLWHTPMSSAWMLVAAVAIQLIVAIVDFPADRIENLGFALLMASYALLLAFCFVNIRLPGFWVIAAGIALNTVVVGLNQGMPTADRERTTASGATVERPIERTVKQRPESDEDLVGFLGDVIEIPGPIDNTISIGDILIAAGGLYTCFRLTRRPRAAAAATAVVETEFADFWGPESMGEELSTEEIGAVTDATIEDISEEPEPAVIVWDHRQATGEVEPEPVTFADEPPEVVTPPEPAEVEAEPVETELPGPATPVDPAAGVEPFVANGNSHVESKLEYDDDELERKLSAAENVLDLHSTGEPPTPRVADAPKPKQKRKPQPQPAPDAPHASDAPAEPVASDEISADDPLADELEKLFSRLSRRPGESEG